MLVELVSSTISFSLLVGLLGAEVGVACDKVFEADLVGQCMVDI